MNRYISSFIITAVLYTAAIASVLYTISSSNYSDKDVKVNDVQKVSFSIVTPEVKPQKEKVKKQEQKKEPKVVQKPKPNPIPQKKVEQSQPKPEPIKEEIAKEEKSEESQKEIQEVQKQTHTNMTNNKVCENQTKAKKDIFISNLIKQINSNKSYPKSAKRRGIEGDVDIEFTILSDGSVKDINMLLGKNVFKTSAIEAINKSFPIQVEESLFDFPKKFKIKIAYVLK